MARSTRRRGQAVTIQAVAERAGVSAMTVSNVINGAGKASDATRANVLAAIAALGYKPNIAAQALASAGVHRIGLIYGDPQNAFLSAMLVGALHATTARGVQLVIQNLERHSYQALVVSLRALVRSGANAILMAPPYPEMLAGQALIDELGVPIAAVATGKAMRGLTTARIDDRAAAYCMTEMLIGLGHLRIGFIMGPPGHSSSGSRREGYEEALRAHDLPVAPELLASGDFSFESGLWAAEHLLNLDKPPTAIFASSDDMAAAAVSVAHRRNLDVPKDVAISGFDDTPIASKIWPTLTTIRQPIADLAERATLALIAHMRDPGQSVADGDHILDFRLVERDST